MSRIGKKPIPLPSGVKVNIEDNKITISGPKGILVRQISPLVTVELVDNQLLVKNMNDSRQSHSIHGLTRTLLNNMIIGVANGFQKELIVTGVGYKIEEKGDKLIFNLGHSHPIEFPLPKGITAKVDRQKIVRIILEGYDKELLGLVASKIRALRPPEPYKGKGIQFADENIIRKAGKTATKSKK
ncbi:MAG: 50S ribosomal protein L6 [Dissulfurimicrobium sp.]|uniref:50S ribosomal protein L6 n=1 Tax=Dissulfurimicrobium TaxID=1769732 RepID=UPI001EDBBBEB|nr:50S ribosomal protein L6 [Dissulfurimicrobium hydrothermale]UKL14334.1 50S ribosomal protein L6 [Dissulfurimicrobium hydrothermale]